MKTMPLQWSVDINTVAHAAADFTYEASPEELDGLKRYAEVEDLTSFNAIVKIAPRGHGRFAASGVLRASVVQSSVVDLGAVSSSIEESFSVDYWPEDSIDVQEGEIAFDTDLPEAIVGGRIPIGELLSELFALSIDPYPRNEGDEFQWSSARPEPDASPFADLARYRVPKDGSGE